MTTNEILPAELMAYGVSGTLALELCRDMQTAEDIFGAVSLTESSIIANAVLNEAIIIDRPITLTSNLTLTVPLTIVYGGRIITNGFTLTINGAFSVGPGGQGDFQVFTSALGEVVFGIGATEVVMPQWFGAVVDGTTNDSTAMNKALNSVGTSATAKIFLSSGVWSFNQGWNCTGKTGLIITGVHLGSTLYFQTSNTPGIDLTGSSRCHLEFLQCTSGSGATSPNVLLLLARNSGGTSAGWHTFHKCQFMGPNSGSTMKAVIYSYASEDVEFTSCECNVINPQAKAVMVTSKNDLSVASSYATIATGEQSNTAWTWFGGTVSDYSTQTGANTSYPFWLHNARDVTLQCMSGDYSGNAYVHVMSDGPGLIVDVFVMTECRIESSTLNGLNVIEGDVANIGWSIGSLTGNMFSCSNAVIYEPGSPTIYCGLIQGNNFTSLAPTRFIDGLIADIQSGDIDILRKPIRLSNIYGARISNVAALTDITATSILGSTFQTSGVTQGKFKVGGTVLATLAVYANNAAAVAGGLIVGEMYRTGADPDVVCITH